MPHMGRTRGQQTSYQWCAATDRAAAQRPQRREGHHRDCRDGSARRLVMLDAWTAVVCSAHFWRGKFRVGPHLLERKGALGGCQLPEQSLPTRRRDVAPHISAGWGLGGGGHVVAEAAVGLDGRARYTAPSAARVCEGYYTAVFTVLRVKTMVKTSAPKGGPILRPSTPTPSGHLLGTACGMAPPGPLRPLNLLYPRWPWRRPFGTDPATA